MHVSDALVSQILISLCIVSFGRDGWQEILDHVVFPVGNLAVSFYLVGVVVVVVDVESRVVSEISESDSVETL